MLLYIHAQRFAGHGKSLVASSFQLLYDHQPRRVAISFCRSPQANANPTENLFVLGARLKRHSRRDRGLVSLSLFPINHWLKGSRSAMILSPYNPTSVYSNINSLYFSFFFILSAIPKRHREPIDISFDITTTGCNFSFTLLVFNMITLLSPIFSTFFL